MALVLSRVDRVVEMLAEDQQRQHTRHANFSVQVDGWDSANVVPYSGAMGTVGQTKATLYTVKRFSTEDLSRLRFQFNKVCAKTRSHKHPPPSPFNPH